MSPQEKVLDRLEDAPNVSEEKVFQNLIKVNNESQFRLSGYVLADMWNKTDAVSFKFAKPRTAHDFLEAEMENK